MKTLLLSSVCVLLLTTAANAQLTGMSPNQAVHNQTLQTTITSNGLFIQSFSPNGNVFQIFLKQGGYTITVTDLINNWWGDNTTVLDPNTVQSDLFTVPISVPAGSYDLEVLTADVFDPWSNQVTYTLPGAFTVLPPDGYVSGTVYEDLNQNGVKDSGEPGEAGRNVRLFPVGASAYELNTGTNGVYNFPVANGSYNATVLAYSSDRFFVTSQDTLPATVNNNTAGGIDFGIRYALQSVTPNTGYRGINTQHQIVSDEPIFATGANAWGNVTQLTVTSNYTTNVALSNITVIDPYTIRAFINIPANFTPATGRNIRVSVTGTYAGSHWLKGKFNIATPPYFVSGSTFFDQNQNKLKDTGEPGIRYVKINMAPENSIAFTSYSGDFLLGSLGGAQTLSYDLGSITGLALFTDSSTYTFTANTNITNKNFGFLSTNPDYSVLVSNADLFARCNTQQYAYFEVRNTSNISYNVRPWVKFSSNMNFISSLPAGATVSNDTVFFPVFNILPYTSVNRWVRFALPGVGSTVNFTVGATSLNGSGVEQLTSTMAKTYPVFCAYDPNDKQVTPPGIFAQNYTLMSDTLEYLIRFQNTGNDTAFKVVIVDTLDMDLDINTFELLGSSHDIMTEIKANGAMTFTFNNINLPDSNVNEPLSHGFIRYRIRMKPGLPDATPVNNTAYIYFDFNPAIVTNTTLNTMVYVLPVGLNEAASGIKAILYPNPFSTTATLHFANDKNELFSLIISDITGKQVMPVYHSRDNNMVIDRKHLAGGIYFYQLRKQDGTVVTGKFVVE
jgi:uncharacterized repeat protein (TIGR01451 family)